MSPDDAPAAPLFPDIIGQPRVTGPLQHAVREGRLFPSLAFHGPPGVGKLSTALALCRALLCRAAASPCGRCRDCRRIDERALVHPDVRIVLPEKLSDFEKGVAAEGGAAGLDAQATQAEAIKNPVWTILIDRIRQAIGFVQRGPAEGRRAVLIVDQAHRMGAESANALLKTLEEPPDHAVIILLTPSLHALLPTIRSRCQAVPFQLVAQRAIVDFLVERRGVGAEEAVLRAGLSGGRIGAALDLDLDQFRARRDELLTLLVDLVERGDPGIAVTRAETLARAGKTLEADLDIIMSLVRDAAVLQAVPTAAGRLVNVDIAGRITRLAAAPGGAPGFERAVEALAGTLEAIRHKGNRQLLVEDFLLGLVPAAARAS
jgi:DNA polymerase-3 subunit delta'